MASDRFQSRNATNRELTKFLARVNAEVEVKKESGTDKAAIRSQQLLRPYAEIRPSFKSFFTRSRIYHKIGRKEHFTNFQLVKLNVRNLRKTMGLKVFLLKSLRTY